MTYCPALTSAGTTPDSDGPIADSTIGVHGARRRLSPDPRYRRKRRSIIVWRSSTSVSFAAAARKNPPKERESFATSMVKRPAFAELGPSYVHRSSVNVARIPPFASPPHPPRRPIADKHTAGGVRFVRCGG